MAANKKTIKVYTGEEITFYPDSHRYKRDGDSGYMISPSAIVGILDKSTALMIWNNNLIRSYFQKEIVKENTYLGEEVLDKLEVAFKERERVLEEAKSVGTIVHDYAEAFAYYKVMGGEAPEIAEDTPQAALNGINAFLEWINKHNVEFVDVEKLVYSKNHDYVGHLDALCRIDGKLTLLDYKTSKDVYTSQLYQVAGYKVALIEENKYWGKDENIETYILNFNKETGNLIEYPISQEDHDLNVPAFLGLLAAKKREKQLSKWN